MSDSTLSGYASLVPQPLVPSTGPAAVPVPAAAGAASPKSAAWLARAAQHLLDGMVRKRIPRVEALRRQLEDAPPGPSLAAIDTAVRRLHADTGALDFLAGRTGGERGDAFVVQGAALAAAAQHLNQLAAGFAVHHGTQGPVARLLWIELVLEAASLQKRVRKGAHWLAQMDKELNTRRAAATADVTFRALEELGRRSRSMHERLQTVHRLCGHARSVHVLCEQLAEERAALCATLQAKVYPASVRLADALQPLMEAVAYRPLVPEELMAAIEARHEMQVALTQAAAEIARLRAGSSELASRLAAIAQKAQSLSQAAAA